MATELDLCAVTVLDTSEVLGRMFAKETAF